MSSFNHNAEAQHTGMLRFKKRKSRFSYREIQILLEEVRKNRNIVIGKFNRGVSTEVKKRTWAEITARINEVSLCPREIIEVIKKWSDLKCDTKRKVAAMRAGGLGRGGGGRSRLSRDLTPVESVVHQILQLASIRNLPPHPDDGPYPDLGNRIGQQDGRGPGRGVVDVDEEDEEEEEVEDEEDEDMTGMPSSSVSCSPISRLEGCAPSLPLSSHALPISMSMSVSHKQELGDPTPVYCIAPREDSVSSPYELQYEIPGVDDQDVESLESEEERRAHFLSAATTARLQPAAPLSQVEEDSLLGGGLRRGGGGSTAPTSPLMASRNSLSVREKMVHNATLSIREQRTTNELLETVSRSLELLSESMQQMVETQQDFVRDSLQMQRETVQVLREFTAGALALMHDKLNGHPPAPT
ncbi:t-SNARE domain-containing protein 1 [Amia ocellicauda]|uniref:t-SNARE domain-containing protein 1 n=1 Tax=Amia ocellicauda TaxID=2972642 RepID=UPI0034649F2B